MADRGILANAGPRRNASGHSLCYKGAPRLRRRGLAPALPDAAQPMEITFVTTELSPFVKVGGLADVSAALPKALRSLGHAATIVVPRFPELEAQGLLLARRLTPLRFALGDRTFESTVFDGRLASQVDLVVVDVPGLFDRPGVYGERGEDYPDNAVRFAAFSRAVAELLRQRAAGGRPVDIVHCNDWPTALVPTYLHALASETPALAATRSVLTVHNVVHQGIFPKETTTPCGTPRRTRPSPLDTTRRT
jgi:starch synthase